MTESYELFRYEFSDNINKMENKKIKSEIIDCINKVDKERLTKEIYKIVDVSFIPIYEKVLEKKKIGGSKLIAEIKEIPNLDEYEIKNERDLCGIYKTKDTCINKHCYWNNNECRLALTKDMIAIFVNKMVNELLNNEMRRMEILQIDEYSVSDIVDRSIFTKRKDTTIFKSTGMTTKSIVDELFGKENAPIVGKKKMNKLTETTLYLQLNVQNPMVDMETMFIQNIIPNQYSILRAYVNGYYWLKHPFHDIDTINDANSRNLGFCSELQTDYLNYLRGLMIKSLGNVNLKVIKKYLSTDLKDYIIKMWKNQNTISSGIIELHILNVIQGIPIYIVNDDFQVLYSFNAGNIEEKSDNKITNKTINIQYEFSISKDTPSNVKILYIK